MNEIILNADGTYMVVGDAGSVSGILDRIVKANTTPAVLNDDGSIKTAEVIPAADTLAVEIAADNLKTHAWRLPKARTERLEDIRGMRNAKLKELDVEYQLADEGVHPDGLDKAAVAAKKVTLRDLPTVAESDLAGLNDTDAMSAYVPDALK
jgi:hypothetical protein